MYCFLSLQEEFKKFEEKFVIFDEQIEYGARLPSFFLKLVYYIIYKASAVFFLDSILMFARDVVCVFMVGYIIDHSV